MLKRNKYTKKLRSRWIGYGLRPSLEYLEDRLALSISTAPANAASATLNNETAPTVTLSTSVTSISENDGVVRITAWLSRAVDVTTYITLGYSGTATSDDYQRDDDWMFIRAGQRSCEATITAFLDSVNESPETIIVDITDIRGGAVEATPQQATITIVNFVGADLQFSSTVTNAVAGSGRGNLVYRVTVTNVGPATAKDIEIGFTGGAEGLEHYSTKASKGRFAYGDWLVDSLKSGKSMTLTRKFTVGANATQGLNALSMTAHIFGDTRGLMNRDDDYTTASANITGKADLSVAYYFDSKQVPIDGWYSYQIAVKNAGPTAAWNVSVVEVLPPGVKFDYGDGQKTDAGVVFAIPKINANSTKILTAWVKVDADVAPNQTLFHMASVSSDTPDPKQKNNQSAAMVTPFTQTADLSITQTVPPQVQAGGHVIYEATVTNNGPFVARNVTLTALIPAGATFLHGYSDYSGPSALTQASTSTQASLTIGELYMQSPRKFCFVLWLDEGLSAGQKLINRITVTSDMLDLNSQDNSSTVTTEVINFEDGLNDARDGSIFIANALVVIGTSKNDTILVQRHPNVYYIVQVTINGKVLNDSTHNELPIVIYGGGGDDVITLDSGVDRRAVLFGGAGNDTLTANMKDKNHSEIGTAVLVGGDGNDNLISNDGRNILIGGNGNNILNGAGGENVFIGGSTSYDTNYNALLRLASEWRRSSYPNYYPYDARVAHLRGTFTGGNNGTYVLNSSTVSDNDSVDSIFSGADDNDWFLAHTVGDVADNLNGKSPKEELDEI